MVELLQRLRTSSAVCRSALWAILVLVCLCAPAGAQIRVKDIADVEGVRENQLVGYGLVVGLNGTGDKLDSAVFTRESLVGMLERLGVNTRDQIAKLRTKNVAAVMVTGNLPAFARTGSHLDISVSAIGDATNLAGGTLLVTPMLAADGDVYAVSQGAVTTGAVAARGASGSSVTRNVPTSGKIANGAIVEKEVAYNLAARDQLTLSLRNPDLTTARRIEIAINQTLGNVARATDPRTVVLNLHGRDVVEALAKIEDLRIEPDTPAVVIIDETSGTIVMGANVRISTVAIAQGNLTIRVSEEPQVSQPGAFSKGTTAVTPKSKITIESDDHKLGMLSAAPTLRDLVASLNALGVGPRDLISILQAIKAAGALQADLEVR